MKNGEESLDWVAEVVAIWIAEDIVSTARRVFPRVSEEIINNIGKQAKEAACGVVKDNLKRHPVELGSIELEWEKLAGRHDTDDETEDLIDDIIGNYLTTRREAILRETLDRLLRDHGIVVDNRLEDPFLTVVSVKALVLKMLQNAYTHDPLHVYTLQSIANQVIDLVDEEFNSIEGNLKSRIKDAYDSGERLPRFIALLLIGLMENIAREAASVAQEKGLLFYGDEDMIVLSAENLPAFQEVLADTAKRVVQERAAEARRKLPTTEDYELFSKAQRGDFELLTKRREINTTSPRAEKVKEEIYEVAWQISPSGALLLEDLVNHTEEIENISLPYCFQLLDGWQHEITFSDVLHFANRNSAGDCIVSDTLFLAALGGQEDMLKVAIEEAMNTYALYRAGIGLASGHDHIPHFILKAENGKLLASFASYSVAQILYLQGSTDARPPLFSPSGDYEKIRHLVQMVMSDSPPEDKKNIITKVLDNLHTFKTFFELATHVENMLEINRRADRREDQRPPRRGHNRRSIQPGL